MNNEYGAVVRSAGFFVANSWQVLSEDADSFQEFVILFLLFLCNVIVNRSCYITAGVAESPGDRIETVSCFCKHGHMRMTEEMRMQLRINPMEYLIESVFFER